MWPVCRGLTWSSIDWPGCQSRHLVNQCYTISHSPLATQSKPTSWQILSVFLFLFHKSKLSSVYRHLLSIVDKFLVFLYLSIIFHKALCQKVDFIRYHPFLAIINHSHCGDMKSFKKSIVSWIKTWIWVFSV